MLTMEEDARWSPRCDIPGTELSVGSSNTTNDNDSGREGLADSDSLYQQQKCAGQGQNESPGSGLSFFHRLPSKAIEQ